MDKVIIEGLQVDALIGIHAWERRGPQPLLLDLELAFDNRRAAASASTSWNEVGATKAAIRSATAW